MSKCAGSSVFNVTICCFSLSFVNEMKDLGLSVGQKKLFHPTLCCGFIHQPYI